MAIVTEPTTRGDEVASFRFTSWVSWKSIFAGLIAAIAVGVVLALLGMALGFTVFDPMSGDPLAGVGLTFGLWTLVCGIVSLVVGGYVGGLSAGRYGGTHGFLVGATPSRLLTSSNSGFAMMMPIAFAVSIEDPPPIAMI